MSKLEIKGIQRRHRDLIKGQEWVGVRGTYEYFCSKHGKYFQRFRAHNRSKMCPKCSHLKKRKFFKKGFIRGTKWLATRDVKKVGHNIYQFFRCICGREKWLAVYSVFCGISKSCGKGSCSARFKGGFINKQGYRVIRFDGKTRLEHRVVMEKALGRKLMRKETIHHRNGKRSDNRLRNLQMRLTGTHPAGISEEDVAEWLRNVGYRVTKTQRSGVYKLTL